MLSNPTFIRQLHLEPVIASLLSLALTDRLLNPADAEHSVRDRVRHEHAPGRPGGTSSGPGGPTDRPRRKTDRSSGSAGAAAGGANQVPGPYGAETQLPSP